MVAGVVGLGCVLGGCGEGGTAPGETVVAPSETAVRGRLGVEVRSWVMSDGVVGVEELLASLPVAEGVISGLQVEAWHRAGMSIRLIPLSRLKEIQAALSPRGDEAMTRDLSGGETISFTPVTLQTQWLDPGAAWVQAARGPVRPPSVVAMQDGRVAMPEGAMRLLARCWPIPAAAGESDVKALMRVQLVPQMDEWTEQKLRDPLMRPTAPSSAVDQGLVLKRLLLTLTLDADQVILIVPEAATPEMQPVARDVPEEAAPSESENALKPGEVRRDPLPGEKTETPPSEDESPKDESPRKENLPPRRARMGPEGPVSFSVGQHMLSAAGQSGSVRAVIAIVPALGKSADRH